MPAYRSNRVVTWITFGITEGHILFEPVATNHGGSGGTSVRLFDAPCTGVGHAFGTNYSTQTAARSLITRFAFRVAKAAVPFFIRTASDNGSRG